MEVQVICSLPASDDIILGAVGDWAAVGDDRVRWWRYGTAKVPNPNARIGPCNELATNSGMYPSPVCSCHRR